jgi:hypothetical protein
MLIGWIRGWLAVRRERREMYEHCGKIIDKSVELAFKRVREVRLLVDRMDETKSVLVAKRITRRVEKIRRLVDRVKRIQAQALRYRREYMG